MNQAAMPPRQLYCSPAYRLYYAHSSGLFNRPIHWIYSLDLSMNAASAVGLLLAGRGFSAFGQRATLLHRP